MASGEPPSLGPPLVTAITRDGNVVGTIVALDGRRYDVSQALPGSTQIGHSSGVSFVGAPWARPYGERTREERIAPTFDQLVIQLGEKIGAAMGGAAVAGDTAIAEQDAWNLALSALANLRTCVERAQEVRKAAKEKP